MNNKTEELIKKIAIVEFKTQLITVIMAEDIEEMTKDFKEQLGILKMKQKIIDILTKL